MLCPFLTYSVWIEEATSNEYTETCSNHSGWQRKMGKSQRIANCKAGHVQGAKNIETVCEAAYNMGIQYLTVYAFSTENWNRPQDEVDALMQLLRNYMKTCLKTAARNNMCVRVIGDKTRLADDIKESIAALEEATKDYTGLHFQIALNYGSRDEITRAVRLLAQKVADGELTPDQITEESIAGQLDTAGIPDPV